MMRNTAGAVVRIASVLAVLFFLAAPQRGYAAQCSVQQGQALIDAGRYDAAIRGFTCVMQAQPTEVEGYRGRIEAQLLSGRYSDAVRTAAALNAFVLPVHPDAETTILQGYNARLTVAPQSISALTGKSFAYWWFFEYQAGIQVLNDLLVIAPNNVYGNLFRGSSRLLHGATPNKGVADLERAIQLAPQSPDVHYVVADAYTYGQSDPVRAFAEASFALNGGLDTPRVHAILATSYIAFGDMASAALHLERHIELVTTQLVPAPAIAPGTSLVVNLVPGRTFEIPVPATIGQTISITTDSPTHEVSDSILVMVAPDGTPVVGGDDYIKYFAGFVWTAEETGTYLLRVTSFESVSTGQLAVTRR
jgi:tetratricopeptide (TPR) repeat protein